MAGLTALRRSLDVLANNYGKPSSWAEENLKLWMRNLSDVSDADLLRGVETWCRDQARLPNLARFRAVIESSPIRRAPAIPPGCPCCDGTGQREIGRWYQPPRTETLRSEMRIAACDCPRGEAFAQGAYVPWERALEAWKIAPETTTPFNSTASEPHLRTDQRLTPDELEAWKALAKRKASATAGETWQHPIRSRR